MTWTAIIAIIIQILNFIFGIFNPGPTPRQAQYTCGSLKWTQAPKMVDGHLVGRAEQNCKVEGRSGGGLQQLKAHLAQRVMQNAYQVAYKQGEAVYSVKLDSQTDGQPLQVSGQASLSGNAAVVRHSFEQSAVYTSSDAKYVVGVQAAMEVTPSSKSHWYNVSTSEAVKIKKPAFMSNSYFQSKIVSEMEAAMADHVVDAMSDLASHL
jgi:hypothetical protein